MPGSADPRFVLQTDKHRLPGQVAAMQPRSCAVPFARTSRLSRIDEAAIARIAGLTVTVDRAAEARMTDSLGYRTKFAVVAPSTHSSVEPQNSGTHPRGVTDHFSHIPDTKVTDDASFVVMPNIPYPLPKRLRSPNSGWKAGDRDQCGGFGRLPTEF